MLLTVSLFYVKDGQIPTVCTTLSELASLKSAVYFSSELLVIRRLDLEGRGHTSYSYSSCIIVAIHVHQSPRQYRNSIMCRKVADPWGSTKRPIYLHPTHDFPDAPSPIQVISATLLVFSSTNVASRAMLVHTCFR